MALIKAAEVSEYERKRQETIAKNQELLRRLAADAASAGLAPAPSARSRTTAQRQGGSTKDGQPARPQRRNRERQAQSLGKRKKEEEEALAPRRQSLRLRGLVADSEVAKRKAEEEYKALEEFKYAKRQRVSGDLKLSDVVVAGKGWESSGNYLAGLAPATPNKRTFTTDDVEATSNKTLRGLREKLCGLSLWDSFEPSRIKITTERIYSLALHPTRDKPLVFAGDKLGNLGVCDCSQEAVSAEEDEEDEEGSDPAVTTFKIHTRAISAFRFCPADGNKLFSCSYDSTIRKLDLEKAVSVEVYSPSDSSADEPISGVEVSPTSPETVYYSTLDGRFAILDCRVPSSSGRQVLRLSDKKIGGFSVHPGAPHIVATASLDRMLKLWDLRKISGKGDWRLPTLVGEHESRLSVSHAAFNAAGQVATASYDDTVKIYDFPSATTWSPGTTLSDAEMKPSAIVRHNNQTGRWVTILRAQWQEQPQDGVERLCIGNMNRFVDIYSSSGEQLAQLGGAGITAVPAVARFHPSMDWLAAGTASGKLCLWM